MAVRSRVRRGGAFVVLLALVLLLGRGLGWLPGGGGAGAGGGDGGSADNDVRRDAEPAAPQLAAMPTVVSANASPVAASATPDANIATPIGVEPPAGAATASTPAVPAGEAPGSGRGGGDRGSDDGSDGGSDGGSAVDDRGLARRALVEQELQAGRVGAALTVFERVAGDGGDAAVAALRARLTQAVAVACERLQQAVREGRALAARDELAALLDGRQQPAVVAIDEMCARSSWPQLTNDEVVRGHSLPSAEVALRDRVVRLPSDPSASPTAAPVRARVVAESERGVTVRAVGALGVTFPTLPAWSVEPEAVTAAEAAELGLLAAAAGEGGMARLWCAVALARTGAADSAPRLQLLRAALR